MNEIKLLTDKEKTAFFTGHRDIPEIERADVTRKTKSVIRVLYERGYRHFIAGGALGFDTLAAEAVLAARRYYGDVTLELCLPCRNQTRLWNQGDIELYNLIMLQCDYCTFLYDDYVDGCMLERNRVMVDKSSYCIAYLKKNNNNRSGTAMTVRYAARCGLKMSNLADMK